MPKKKKKKVKSPKSQIFCLLCCRMYPKVLFWRLLVQQIHRPKTETGEGLISENVTMILLRNTDKQTQNSVTRLQLMRGQKPRIKIKNNILGGNDIA